VLLLAPEPFYIERGTPIATDLVLRALSERGDTVDVLTYHVGRPMVYDNVVIHRIPNLPFIREIPAGPSLRKLFCSALLYWYAVRMSRQRRYDVIHAIEDAAIVAAFIRRRYGVPFVYDMDSYMPQQLIAAYPYLRPLGSWLRHGQNRILRVAATVMPASEPVADIASRCRGAHVVPLPDISLLQIDGPEATLDTTLQELCGHQGPFVMYAGSLAKNRGIDLLLNGFAISQTAGPAAHLAIIGGTAAEIGRYRRVADALGIGGAVTFLGGRPVRELGAYLAQATILVSPQSETINTPMKIYSYRAACKPILATDLPAHTSVLNEKLAVLVPPNANDFGAGLVQLLSNPALRQSMAEHARRTRDDVHTYGDLRDVLWSVYEEIEGYSV
jgi:glycosyltransferase involved in cell wall biosynthesis